MPCMIRFMLTRFAAGFAIGCTVGLVICQQAFPATGAVENYLVHGLFVYFFASTIGMGYLATALLLEE
ncbi:hypothetical protein [Rhizobium bangladeshense]|uniref:hypothetical protein n=1 Tax=Rhizobium bangladeshense TaxID=1138189 RepID=UPI0007E5382C|nr:hypothetical protein [Rhizobium bangladeshense]